MSLADCFPIDPKAYRALPVVGTRRKQWTIVSEHGGLIAYFSGTQAQANIEAQRLWQQRKVQA